jgi:hypothetical protein
MEKLDIDVKRAVSDAAMAKLASPRGGGGAAAKFVDRKKGRVTSSD